jgi:hypothetical protein
MEGICVLQVDGLEYVFTHRSFQEYFAAHFITRSPPVKIADVLDQFCKRREDAVVKMAVDMNHGLLEREWIVPRLKKIISDCERLHSAKNPIHYINSNLGQLEMPLIGVNKFEFIYSSTKTDAHVRAMILELYNDHFSSTMRWVTDQQGSDRAIVKAALEKLMKSNDERLQGLASLDTKVVKARGLYSIELSDSDSSWIAKTRLPEYERRILVDFKKLLSDIGSRSETKNKMLESLLGDLA